MVHKSGFLINSLFALSPNALQMCGSKAAQSAMQRCISTGDCDDVAKELRSFRTLWPYLQFIAEVLRESPLDPRPAACYWLGEPAVFRVNASHLEILFRYFSQQTEIPAEYIAQLRKDPPKKLIPFHLFQVLLSAKHHGGINEASLPGINQCMVAWGKVLDLNGNSAEVELNQLRLNKYGHLELTTERPTLAFNPVLVPKLKVRDLVASHWGNIAMVITPIAANRLEKATTEVLKIQGWI